MKKTILLITITMSTLIITGCGSTQNTVSNTVPATPYTISAEFAEQFEACEKNPRSCDLDRDSVIEGSITKINEANIWEFSNFVEISTIQWGFSTIPLLPDTQQKRSTIIVNTSWDIIAFEDIIVWDKIKASVKSFDVFEAGELKEKLGQYWYIQITAQ